MNSLSWIVAVTAISAWGARAWGSHRGRVPPRSDKAVSLLLSFAGGVMLGVVCFDLLVSAIDPGGSFGAPAGLGIAVFGVLWATASFRR
jgi:ZIP family zinc transporter